METIKWTPLFETGFETIDEQHHRLVELTNQLGTGVMENRLTFHSIQELMKELADYARYHFDVEEHLMASAHVDPRYVRQHQSEHVDFLKYIVTHARHLTAEDSRGLLELMSYLTRWLVFHILGLDKEYARQIVAIRESGLSPEEAYLEYQSAGGGAANILLDALNGLVKQLSERNLALTELNSHLEEKVAERTRELSEANHRLEEMALTDALTNLPNRRHAMSQLNQLFKQLAIQHDKSLSCLMIDADGFKQMNDNFGHDAGDIVLRELSGALRMGTRTDDFVSRLGGDEFLILCPSTDLPGAILVADALCDRVSSMRVKAGEGIWCGSISIGVATATCDTESAEQLIKLADQSVYIAKRDGKGCVRSVQK